MATLEQYKGMLQIVKHRLDDELEIQPQVMDRIATEVVIHNSKMLQAKEDLASLEASLLEDLRDSEEKITVQQATAKVQRDPSRVRAWQKFQAARAEHELWSYLLEAWRQKGYSMKVLSDLYQAQYFTTESHGGQEKISLRIAEREKQHASVRVDHIARTRGLPLKEDDKPKRRSLI